MATFLVCYWLFLFANGILFVHERFQVEYIDNRLFYIINIFCVICLALAILLLLPLIEKWKWIGVSVVILFIMVNGGMLVASNQEIKIQQASHLILNMYYRLKRIQRVGRQFTIGPITVFLLVRKKNCLIKQMAK